MNLKQYDLIGKFIEVMGARNKNLIGLRGRVIDETKNLIILENGRRIQKQGVEIEVKRK